MSDLLLVPTAGELATIQAELRSDSVATGWLESGQLMLFTIGLGPVTAAARTADLIATYHPRQVTLAGIAGTFDERQMAVGTAHQFGKVFCDGIGVGRGDQFQTAAELGWDQFRDDARDEVIGDCLEIASGGQRSLPAPALLSVCAASASAADRDDRMRRFPSVTAEDMEGFSVAVACQLRGTRLQIIRGISNHVGDRNHSNWQMDTALRAAARLTAESLSASWD